MKKIIFFVFMIGFAFSQTGWSGHAEGNGAVALQGHQRAALQ